MAGSDAERSGPGGVTDAVADASNVLLLASSTGVVDSGGCFELFAPEEPGQARVLGVSYTGSLDRWLEAWREHVGVAPADLVVVQAGGTTRSAAGHPGGTADAREHGPGAALRTVDSPGDLTGLGIVLGEQLSEWDDGAPVTVCFDSLTVLLQYADLQRAFRFLHVLTGRIDAAGARAHYHLDPAAVDGQTVATLASLFDATVRHEDGEWTVRTR